MINRLLNLGYVLTHQEGLTYTLRTPQFQEVKLLWVGGRKPWMVSMSTNAPYFYVSSTSELLEKLNS